MVAEHSEVDWAYAVVYDDLKSCGCGLFESRMEFLRDALRKMPLFENENWKAYDTPLGEWFLCLLDGAELIEHGGSISGSWLTDKGKRFLAVLEDEQSWSALVDDEPSASYCECKDCKKKVP